MLPSSLKKQLSNILKEGFVIKRSVFYKCLEIHPMSEWTKVMNQVNTLNRFVKKNNDFIEGFFNILKNNSKKIIVKVDGVEYQVCLDQNKFKYIENHIVDYIHAQTEEEFIKFVYDKTTN